MPFINPYNFVRRGRQLQPQAPRYHEQFTGSVGRLTCTLRVVTPLFIPETKTRAENQHNALRFFTVNQRPTIPGSSLKGELRSAAEAIANACSPFGGLHGKCATVETLCICCRIFGMLNENQIYLGNVSISDASAEEYKLHNGFVTLRELGSPKPTHTAFYQQAEQQKGRKFYYHQRQVTDAAHIPTQAARTHRNVSIQPVVSGTFRFEIDYSNLTEAELGLLFYTLELNLELYHKIGMGKPLGLGSVQIRIMGMREVVSNPQQENSRYRTLGGGTTEISIVGKEGEALESAKRAIADRIAAAQRAYLTAYCRCPDGSIPRDLWTIQEPNIQDLKVLLSMVNYPDPIRYPSYDWFDKNPNVALPGTQQVHAGSRLP